MSKDSITSKGPGKLGSGWSSELGKTHSSTQTYVSSETITTSIKLNGYHTSNSDFCSKSSSSLSSKNIFSLSLVYLFHTVKAGSETANTNSQPTAASLIEHLGSTQAASSLPGSSSITSSLAPQSTTHTTLSTSMSTLRTLYYPGRETLKSGDIETTNNHQVSSSDQDHIPLHFGQHTHREGEFVCGWGAAFINIFITFPINKTMFRQQLHGISGISAINQLRKDGPRFLYRGLLPPLLQKSSSLSIMFGMYYKCQDILSERIPRMNIFVNHTISGLVAGTLEAIFTPFERIQALMQTRDYHNKFTNTLDAFYGLRSYGLREYYRGLSAVILRNGPSNVAFFLGREYLQKHGPQTHTSGEKVALDFISGACLGAVISTCFFPINVLKIRMQCVLGGPYTGMWSTLKTVVAERKGFIGLYRGVHLNYIRSFISWGIINASYEFLMKTFFLVES